MHPYLSALLVSVVSVAVYSYVSEFFAKRRYAAEMERLGCKPPPLVPNRWPFGVDQVWRSLQADKNKRFLDLCVTRFKEIGAPTHQYHTMGNESIFTIDPKNIQAILATQFHDFGLGPTRRKNFFPLLGNGIFTADGKVWEHSRAMLRPSFARDMVADLDLEERHVQDLMQAVPTNNDGWTSQTDLQVLFFRLTLDSACEFLFGESVGSQIANLPENASVTSAGGASRDEKVFAHAFDRSQQWIARRYKLLDKYWVLDTPDFRRCCRQCHEFCDSFVRRALEPEGKEKEPERRNAGGKAKYVFLDALAQQTRDPVELRSQLLNILLAGRDTTASLLGYLFHTLARHPEIYDKLRAKIIDDFGTYNLPSEITFVTLKNCQYLQHTINETLRLYPVVPVNSRMALKDTTVPRGGGPDGQSPVFVKKGQQVDYSVYVMQRRKDFWGEDADEFKPERWLGKKTGWEYLPFNGGPRICIGRRLCLFVHWL